MNYTFDGKMLTLTVDGKSYATKANTFNLDEKKRELYERYKNDIITS